MMQNDRTAPRGATLLELVVTVAIIGVASAVTALAIHPVSPPDPASPATIIADTVERVLATGTPVTLTVSVNARPAVATVNPDGTIIADSALVVERLSGRMIP